jgi:predicted nucleic acid-binding protein
MIALDSSVIIAALLAWHQEHEAAAAAVEKALASKDGAVIPAHALLESYAVMTRLPAPHRIAPHDALTLLRDNFRGTKLAALPTKAVWPLLDQLKTAGFGGGITYDAVILAAAHDGGATTLLTLNDRDYARLDPRITIARP